MDFGEQITLSEAECKVLQYDDNEFASDWPLEAVLVLEGFVRERILDKQARLDEVKRGIGGTLAADGFRLRRDVGVLEQMHDDILRYVLSPSNQPPQAD